MYLYATERIYKYLRVERHVIELLFYKTSPLLRHLEHYGDYLNFSYDYVTSSFT